MTSPLARRVHGWLAELDAEFAVRQADNAAVASTFWRLRARVRLTSCFRASTWRRCWIASTWTRSSTKVDMDLVLDKLDINEVMSGAIQDLQVTGLRDSTGAIANTTVGVLRTGATGVASRITGRKWGQAMVQFAELIDPELLPPLEALIAFAGPGGFAAIADLDRRRQVLSDLSEAAAAADTEDPA